MYLVFANTCAVQIDDIDPVASIAFLRDEFSFHCFEQSNGLPIVGKIRAIDTLSYPDFALLFHDKNLYVDGNILYCKDCESVVRISLTQEQFVLEVDRLSDGKLLVLVMQTMLNYYLTSYGVTFLHTAAFKYDNEVYAIHGFGGVGKTEIMIEALKRGAQYISDDLALFDEKGRVFPYLRKISLHDYSFTDEQLERLHLDKRRYHLMRWCQSKRGRLLHYLYQRNRGRFNISIRHTLVNTSDETVLPNESNVINHNYWLELSSTTEFKPINKDVFIKKMSFCMANEFRTFSDFDGCLGIVYEFWQEKRERHDHLLNTILSLMDIQCLSIQSGHFVDCANLLLLK